MFRLSALITGVMFIITSLAQAGETDTYGIGARASALGGAVSAWANDPFAVYYNPAGLSLIDGHMISVGASVLQPDITFDDFHLSDSTDAVINGYSTFSDTSDPLVTPAIGYAGKLTEKWAFGCAMYAPWGIRLSMNDDPSKNPSAYSAYESGFNRFGITPSASYQLTPSLSMGFGVMLGRTITEGKKRLYVSNDMGAEFPDYTTSLATMLIGADTASQGMGGPAITTTTEGAAFYTQAASLAPDQVTAATYTQYAGLLGAAAAYGVSTPSDATGLASPSHDAIVDMDFEDSFNYSFNLGLMYRPAETLSLGLTYRGRCDGTMEGDVSSNGQKISNGSLDYKHPEQVQGGIRFFFPKTSLAIETDIVWTNWSINERQVIALDQGLDVYAVPGMAQTQTAIITEADWNDTIQVRVGIEWFLSEMFTLRFGHFYDPSPIPDNTLELVHPDADKRTFSAGLGLHWKKWTLDSFIGYTDIEQARYIGGESVNLNNTYNSINTRSNVSMNASGKIYSGGLTLSRYF